jgi:uncharacterized protein (TIGR04255 family)
LVVSINQADFIAPFQEEIRSKYPILRREEARGLVIGPGGVAAQPPQVAWRFTDADGAWRVSLTPEFLALETTAYSSRSNFLGRLRDVVGALALHVDPKQLDRLGVRYVDRVTGQNLTDIASLVRSEVRGVAGTKVSSHVQQVLTEAVFAVDDARLLARWGHIPPNATVDPAAVEPIAEPSWILDLDMFGAAPRPFGVDGILAEARAYSERIYAFFRWAVEDDFLRRFGGQP